VKIGCRRSRFATVNHHMQLPTGRISGMLAPASSPRLHRRRALIGLSLGALHGAQTCRDHAGCVVLDRRWERVPALGVVMVFATSMNRVHSEMANIFHRCLDHAHTS
jgi:hypothetical protein